MRIESEDQDWQEGEPHGEKIAELQSYMNEQAESLDVMIMRRGSVVSIAGLWEFVPYNDPATQPKNEEQFALRVDELRSKLLHSTNSAREAALAELKQHYLRTFPRSQRNDLSLFLFGGPIGSWNPSCDWSAYMPRSLHVGAEACSGSFLHTGDGNLSSLQKWESLSAYLRPSRAFRPSVLQVPHHGSKYNWFDGLGAMVEPAFSVFSSDPSHRSYNHPHPEVLSDLWPYRPIQVDKENSFWIQFQLSR